MFKPTAEVQVLRKRAQLLHELRAFFYRQNIMEVDVPLLGQSTVTDPFIDALELQKPKLYLQTSPEYFMKRLLVSGSGSIYYLGKACRRDEASVHHRPEFCMLEWYCLGLDDWQLMDQMASLFRSLSPSTPQFRVSYEQAFVKVVGVSPYTASLAQLQDLVKQHTTYPHHMDSRASCLDLLFSMCVQSSLGQGLCFVYHYPQELSSLAKLSENDSGQLVSRRFEVFWNGLELANGYYELQDAAEHQARFKRDCDIRCEEGKDVPEIDAAFLDAMSHGLPECSGVALGVDRLMMCLHGLSDIAESTAFANG